MHLHLSFHTILILAYTVPNIYLFLRILYLFIPKESRLRYVIIYFALAMIYPASNLLSERVADTLRLSIIADYLLPFCLYLFLFTLVFDILLLVNRLIKIIPTEKLKDHRFRKNSFLSVLFLSFCVLIGGIINFNTIRTSAYHIEIPKKSSAIKHLKIAFAADFHLQERTGIHFVERFAEKIREIEPDLLIFGGDIVEGDSNDGNIQEYESILRGMQASYGVYAVLGNHEYYAGQDKGSFFDKAGIKVLCDTIVNIANSFSLAGRYDSHFSGRKTVYDLLYSSPDSLPLILVDHRPTEITQVSSTKADIQLSGHTHNGQLFPINLITRSVYELSWGHMKKGNTHFFVTSGMTLGTTSQDNRQVRDYGYRYKFFIKVQFMDQKKAVVGFIGAGGIARSHAYSLNSLRYFYNDAPEVVPYAVCSATAGSRTSFADRFGFARSCDLDEFLSDGEIDSVYILGPNKVHYEHLQAVCEMSGIRRIYLEKPVCSSLEEEKAIAELILRYPGIKIQVGFQYLFSASVREALAFWKSGKLGNPVHFDVKYYHSDYLKQEYRDKRASRLTPAPDGGAMADLGSHAISLLIAFIGDDLHITSAIQAGSFDEVPDSSDLFSLLSLYHRPSGSAGTLAASRISSGTGDSLSIELYAEKGALRYSSDYPDYYEYYTDETGLWHRKMVGSNFKPVTSFPSGHVPGGWLRAMIHAHYVFLKEAKTEIFVPGIEHGLAVQRLVTQTAGHLEKFRLERRSSWC